MRPRSSADMVCHMRPVGFGALLALAACMTATASPAMLTSSLAGNWSGTVGITQYDAQLTQRAGDLAGAGAIGPAPGSGAAFATRLVELTGTFRASQVGLTFRSQSITIATFSGALVAPDVIRGAIEWDGAPAVPLTLYRR